MKTRSIRKEDIEEGKYPREWWVIDASGQTLGRLSTLIANLLRGKHKVIYTPHVDTGDFVVVVNADKVVLTGKKWSDKIYYHHTRYPGGLKQAKATELLNKKPTALVYNAVKGMMSKNILNRDSLHRLKLYTGPEHPHSAQNPKPFEI
ncbi:MAG: 50S ribosomal protein L13 [SAR324 cluster bacterium]|nr:50S ribosomal protein L13 [SAR324 cluster bacterium]